MARLIIKLGKRASESTEDTERLVEWKSRFDAVLRFIVVILALLAVGAIIAEYGFFLSPELSRTVRTVNGAVLYGFIAQYFLRAFVAPSMFAYFRERIIESVIILFVVSVLLFRETVSGIVMSINPLLSAEGVTRIYLIITQIAILSGFVPGLLRQSQKIMRLNVQPAMLILVSFVVMIFCGSGLLLLPRATTAGISFVDALFTSTSAVCVTGLITVDTATAFTPVGKYILLGLIQIGGLGIMTLTTFFAFMMGSGKNLREYATLQTLMVEESIGAIRQTIIGITVTTFLFEAAGAFLIYSYTTDLQFSSLQDRVFFSVFHAVSAFCNAGFSTVSENLSHPLLQWNLPFLTTVMVLITIGGIGYPVLSDLGKALSTFKKPVRARLAVHTKLVLTVSGILIVFGTLMLFLLERNGIFAGYTVEMQVFQSLFHSVTSRTAGFNTINIGSLSVASLFLIIVLMWIGASPGSTGGGIKTTTFALAVLNIRAIVTARNRVETFGRQVSDLALTKAFSTTLLSFMFIGAGLFALLITEPFPFEQIMFEVVSAMGTVGLSTGITMSLSSAGKLILVCIMLAGRVGLLSTVMALTPRRDHPRYEFPKENIIVT